MLLPGPPPDVDNARVLPSVRTIYTAPRIKRSLAGQRIGFLVAAPSKLQRPNGVRVKTICATPVMTRGCCTTRNRRCRGAYRGRRGGPETWCGPAAGPEGSVVGTAPGVEAVAAPRTSDCRATQSARSSASCRPSIPPGVPQPWRDHHNRQRPRPPVVDRGRVTPPQALPALADPGPALGACVIGSPGAGHSRQPPAARTVGGVRRSCSEARGLALEDQPHASRYPAAPAPSGHDTQLPTETTSRRLPHSRAIHPYLIVKRIS